jgi:predicted DNA-binding transcriptional regulator AlpA
MSTVRALETPQPERYVTRSELAALMGVSVKTVDRMVAGTGMPSDTWGLRSRRFLPSRALAWARTRPRSAA